MGRARVRGGGGVNPALNYMAIWHEVAEELGGLPPLHKVRYNRGAPAPGRRRWEGHSAYPWISPSSPVYHGQSPKGSYKHHCISSSLSKIFNFSILIGTCLAPIPDLPALSIPSFSLLPKPCDCRKLS